MIKPDGAYTVGGGSYNFGQSVNEDNIRSAFELPMPDKGNMVELLRMALESLPLETLKPFKGFLNLGDSEFSGVGQAVQAIIGSLKERHAEWVKDFETKTGLNVDEGIKAFLESLQDRQREERLDWISQFEDKTELNVDEGAQAFWQSLVDRLRPEWAVDVVDWVADFEAKTGLNVDEGMLKFLQSLRDQQFLHRLDWVSEFEDKTELNIDAGAVAFIQSLVLKLRSEWLKDVPDWVVDFEAKTGLNIDEGVRAFLLSLRDKQKQERLDSISAFEDATGLNVDEGIRAFLLSIREKQLQERLDWISEFEDKTDLNVDEGAAAFLVSLIAKLRPEWAGDDNIIKAIADAARARADESMENFAAIFHRWGFTKLADWMEDVFNVKGIANNGVANAAIATGLVNVLEGLFRTRLKSGSNLCANPGFEDTNYWIASGNEYSTDVKRSGSRSLKVFGTGNYSGSQVITDNKNVVFLPCSDGDILYVECWVYGAATNVYTTPGAVGPYIQVWAKDSAGVDIYVSPSHAANVDNLKGKWTKIGGYVTMPSNAVSYTVQVMLQRTVPAGEIYYFDDIVVREVTEGRKGFDLATLASANAQIALANFSQILDRWGFSKLSDWIEDVFGVKITSNNANTNANTALANFQVALTKFGFGTVASWVDDLFNTKGTASTANSTANTANSTANTANTKATNVQGWFTLRNRDFENLVAGSDFEATTCPWQLDPVTPGFTLDTSVFRSGTKSLKISQAAAQHHPVYLDMSSNPAYFECKAGEQFYAELWVKKSADYANTHGQDPRFRVVRGNGANAGQTIDNISMVPSRIPTTDWTKLSVTATVPSDATTCTQLYFCFTGPQPATVTGNLWVDDIVVRRVRGIDSLPAFPQSKILSLVSDLLGLTNSSNTANTNANTALANWQSALSKFGKGTVADWLDDLFTTKGVASNASAAAGTADAKGTTALNNFNAILTKFSLPTLDSWLDNLLGTRSTADTANSTANSASSAASTAGTNIQNTWNNLWDAFNGTSNSTGKTLANLFERAGFVRSTANTANSTANTANTAASTAGTNIQNTWNNLWDAFNGTSGSSGKTLANLFERAGNVRTRAEKGVTDSATAQGTANTANTSANTGLTNWQTALNKWGLGTVASWVDDVWNTKGTASTASSTANTANTAASTAGTNVQNTWNNLWDAFNGTTGSSGKTLANLFDRSKWVKDRADSGVANAATAQTAADTAGANGQTTVNNIANAFLGTNETGVSLATAFDALKKTYNSLNDHNTRISNLESGRNADAVKGKNVSVNFNRYSNGALPPAEFTVTYTGSGTSTIGVLDGVAQWINTNNVNRDAKIIHTTSTDTDFQVLRGTMSTAPQQGQSTAPRFWAIGRVSADGNSYVWARGYCTGLLQYKGDIGCTVNGVETVWASNIALSWSLDMTVVLGVGTNARQYQVYSGNKLVYTHTESGTVSQLGVNNRRFGVISEIRAGTNNPRIAGGLAGFAVSDNESPTYNGSLARLSRTLTANATLVGGDVDAGLPDGFFDVPNYESLDIDANTADGTFTIKPGTPGKPYFITARVQTGAAFTGWCGLLLQVYKNNVWTTVQYGSILGSPGANDAWTGSWIQYLVGGEKVRIGTRRTGINVNAINGGPDGKAFFSIAGIG